MLKLINKTSTCVLIVYFVVLNTKVCHGQLCEQRENLPEHYTECDGIPHVLHLDKTKINVYCGRNSTDQEKAAKVANGRDANVGETPHMVAIIYNGAHHCGGSLIDNTHILTASHCLILEKSLDHHGNGIPPEELTVVLGTIYKYDQGYTERRTDVTIRKVANWFPHKAYRQEAFGKHGPYDGHDIAVMVLEDPVPFSKTIWPICVGTYNAYLGRANSNKLILSGFGADGRKRSSKLQISEDMEILTKEDCTKAITEGFEETYHDGELCTTSLNQDGSAACRGDSGGPLAQVGANGQMYAVGVVSFGPPQCRFGVTDKPDVFADVRFYSDWIESKTASWEDNDGASVLTNSENVSGKICDTQDNCSDK